MNTARWKLVFFAAAFLSAQSRTDLTETEYVDLSGSAILVQAAVPLYPRIAIAAHQSGIVRLKVSVKEGRVTLIAAESRSPSMLVKNATENVKTWVFSKDTYGSFTVTYSYELESEGIGPQNSRVDFRPPTLVRIVARPSKAD